MKMYRSQPIFFFFVIKHKILILKKNSSVCFQAHQKLIIVDLKFSEQFQVNWDRVIFKKSFQQTWMIIYLGQDHGLLMSEPNIVVLTLKLTDEIDLLISILNMARLAIHLNLNSKINVKKHLQTLIEPLV